MNGSRFFVLKTRWMSIDDKDWGLGVLLNLQIISRFQRLAFSGDAVPGPLAQAFTFRAFGAWGL